MKVALETGPASDVRRHGSVKVYGQCLRGGWSQSQMSGRGSGLAPTEELEGGGRVGERVTREYRVGGGDRLPVYGQSGRAPYS